MSSMLETNREVGERMLFNFLQSRFIEHVCKNDGYGSTVVPHYIKDLSGAISLRKEEFFALLPPEEKTKFENVLLTMVNTFAETIGDQLEVAMARGHTGDIGFPTKEVADALYATADLFYPKISDLNPVDTIDWINPHQPSDPVEDDPADPVQFMIDFGAKVTYIRETYAQHQLRLAKKGEIELKDLIAVYDSESDMLWKTIKASALHHFYPEEMIDILNLKYLHDEPTNCTFARKAIIDAMGSEIRAQFANQEFEKFMSITKAKFGKGTIRMRGHTYTTFDEHELDTFLNMIVTATHTFPYIPVLQEIRSDNHD